MKFILFLIISLNIFCECPNQRTVRIVSSFPLTGSSYAQASTMVNAIKMAVDEANEKCLPFKIEYLSFDDASPQRGTWDPAIEATNADKAIADQDVVAYIGTYNSGAAKVSIPKTNKANLLQVSPGNTYPGLTKKGFGEANEPAVYRQSGRINYFRVVPTDDLQGPAYANFAKELGIKSIYILHDRETYGEGIAKILAETAQELGIKVLGFDGIDSKASNYKALSTKIRILGAEAVFFGGMTQSGGGQLVKDLRYSGYKNYVLLPDGCFEPSFINAAGVNNIYKTYFSFGGIPSKYLDGAGKIFHEKYISKFKEEPAAYALYAYDTARVIIEAISKTKNYSRLEVLDSFRNIKDFDGLLGKFGFDENGDVTRKEFSINTVENKDFKFIKRIQ